MAKGTKYSNVNFNVPEGADPLGIGVPNLGRSSYDPIATIQQGWEKSRQERLMQREMNQKNYQSFLKAMPTVDAMNRQLASTQNEKLKKMGALFQQLQAAGGFAGLSKNAKGEKISAELSRLENEIATDVPIINHYTAQYAKDLAVLRNPNNAGKIDQKLSEANVNQFMNAKTAAEVAQPFANNRGSLVVFKPEEVDMTKFIRDGMATYLKGNDKTTTFNGIDMQTGKLKETVTEGVDQKRVYDAMMKTYRAAGARYKNQIDEWYRNAPAPEKKDANGIEMDAGSWFASQFAPDYGRSKTTKYTTPVNNKSTGVNYGARDATGKLKLVDMRSVKQMKAPVSMQTTTLKRRRLGGAPVYYEPTTEDKVRDVTYNSVSVPMSGVTDTFEVLPNNTFMHANSGEAPEVGKATTNKPVSVEFIPTWEGSPYKVTGVEVTDPKTGNKSKETFTLKNGDRIPEDLLDQLKEEGRATYSFKPYLITKAVYSAAIDKQSDEGLTWNQYVSRNGKTTIAPFSEVKGALYSMMRNKGYDTKKFSDYLDEVSKELNGGLEDIFK